MLFPPKGMAGQVLFNVWMEGIVYDCMETKDWYDGKIMLLFEYFIIFLINTTIYNIFNNTQNNTTTQDKFGLLHLYQFSINELSIIQYV